MALKKEIGGIIKHSTIYGVGNLLHRLPPLVLLPLYLNYLTPADFGKKEVISLVVEFLGIVIAMGVASAMARFFYEYKDEGEQNEVISTIVISYAVVAGIILAAIATQAHHIARVVVDNAADKHLVVLALSSLWMNTIYHMLGSYLRIREKSITFVSLSLTKLVLHLTLNVVFIVHLQYGVFGIFLATFISALVFTILISIPLLIKIGVRVSLPKLKEIVSFGAPLIIAQLGGAIVHMSDRYFVKAYISLASAGIYTLGYRLGNSIHYLVTSPFQQIWNPRRFAIQKNEDAKAIYASVFTYYLFLVMLSGALVAACARDIILIAGQPKFYEAATIAPLITLSYVLFGAQHHFTTGIMIRKRTKYFAYIQLVTASVNIALNFIIIPLYGIMGAALATLASMIVKLILTGWLSQRAYPVRWEWMRILRIAGAGVIAWYACSFLSYPGVLESWVDDFEMHKLDIRMLGLKYLGYRCLMVLGIYMTVVFMPGFLRQREMAFARKKYDGLKLRILRRDSRT